MTQKKPQRVARPILTLDQHPLFVSRAGLRALSHDEITPTTIGEKAVGLSYLSSEWTLPFVCVSAEMFGEFNSTTDDKLFDYWEPSIRDALVRGNVRPDAQILIRSSARTEGLAERGKFYSVESSVADLRSGLKTCLRKLREDPDTRDLQIPILIQQLCKVVAKGHLSNERRCYKEARDWMGEVESAKSSPLFPFQINLRNWREGLLTKRISETPLDCSLQALISKVLEAPATWAYLRQVRIHFEWVWDGNRIYLVQADREVTEGGVDPLLGTARMPKLLAKKELRCLRRATTKDGEKFPKIANVFIYESLGISMPPIYILDDRVQIEALAKGTLADELKADLLKMLKGSLVIRSDINDGKLPKRQLLPRSNELRDFGKVSEWLEGKSAKLLKEFPETEIALLFHNFVPAIASAFSYSAPNERTVMIEGLWGIPEGLYYNAHDKYIVDTGAASIKQLTRGVKDKFVIKKQINYKRFFVSPDTTGDWTRKLIQSADSWRSTLTDEWCKTIAYNARRIAEKVGRPISIMWFAGVGGDESKVIPWYHEPMEWPTTSGRDTSRRKTIFDKSFTVETTADMAALEKAYAEGERIKRIRVLPKDEVLLREKASLEKIGSIAKKLDATIVLEGGLLSHAYYQLNQTKAVVEVVHPFLFPDEKHEYNKLVRDKIPANIVRVGEEVRTLRLRGDALIRALKEKLVEEALEVVDSKDQRTTLMELADVAEIVDELLERLQLKRSDLLLEQDAKRQSKGGFKRGLLLVETINAFPKNVGEQPIQIEFLANDKSVLKELLETPATKIDKWTDRQSVPGVITLRLGVAAPILSQGWSATTPSQTIHGSFAKVVVGEITGKREDKKIVVELSVRISDSHPELDFSAEDSGNAKKSEARGRRDAG